MFREPSPPVENSCCEGIYGGWTGASSSLDISLVKSDWLACGVSLRPNIDSSSDSDDEIGKSHSKTRYITQELAASHK
jgi:hypothetical protein